MIDIAKLKTTQHRLNRAHQLPKLVEEIRQGGYVEPIQIARLADGTMAIENGHHRTVAAWLAGRRFLRKYEYILVEKDFLYRSVRGEVSDLVVSIEDEEVRAHFQLDVFSVYRHYFGSGDTHQAACRRFWHRAAA